MKIATVLAVVLLIGIILPGCSCGEDTAKLKVEFNPNPVTPQNDYWRWQVTVSEVGGADVVIDSIVMATYNNDQFLSENSLENLEKILPGGRLPASQKLSFGAGFPCQSITHCIFTVKGKDDNGHEIMAEGKVKLELD